MKVRTRRPRKLLSASLGVAAVSYVACGGSSTTVANLVAPPVDAAAGAGGAGGFVGNLVPPPFDAFAGAGGTGNPRDAASGTGGGAGTVGNPFDVVANLVVAPADAEPDRTDAPSDATRDGASDAPGEGGSPLDVVANLVIAPQDGGQ